MDRVSWCFSSGAWGRSWWLQHPWKKEPPSLTHNLAHQQHQQHQQQPQRALTLPANKPSPPLPRPQSKSPSTSSSLQRQSTGNAPSRLRSRATAAATPSASVCWQIHGIHPSTLMDGWMKEWMGCAEVEYLVAPYFRREGWGGPTQASTLLH